MEKEEIEKKAEIEYPIIDWADESTTFNREQHNKRIGFIKGYQKCQQEAKIVEGMKMDEKQELSGWKSNEGFDIGAA